jgi:hypothetical protein
MAEQKVPEKEQDERGTPKMMLLLQPYRNPSTSITLEIQYLFPTEVNQITFETQSTHSLT